MNVRELILKSVSNKKLTSRGLLALMRAQGIEEASFYDELTSLKNQGLIRVDKKGFYKKVKKFDNPFVTGKINIDSMGIGFVYTADKRKYYVKEENLSGALDGDIVAIHILKQGKDGYGEAFVEEIVSREKGKAIFEYIGNGKFTEYNSKGNIQIVCPKEDLKSLVSGNLVTITLGGKIVGTDKFEGRIDKVVGHKDDPEISLKAIAADHGFYTNFSKEAMKELKTIPKQVTQNDIIDRIDLRNKTIFTIDGSNTKDMDDAISIDIDENGNYILGIHIADVAHYIKEGSALDKEAYQRATSLYLDDSVIPMFPHEISNGICSLNEGEDRLCKSVNIKVDCNGNIIDYEIYDSVINSKKKMTYEEVNQILEEDIIPSGYEEYTNDLLLMHMVAETLRKKRIIRGNIDFSSDDLEIKKDKSDIIFEEKNQRSAERLIENFMIAANETVTKHYSTQNLPFIYRVHGDPKGYKLVSSLRRLIKDGVCSKDAKSLISKINSGKYTSKDINDFLEKYRNTSNYQVISKTLLTSMDRAKYSDINEGHYGLALDYYTHFTSPIRRYPDLVIHRLVDKYKHIENLDLSVLLSSLKDISEHSSDMEKEATMAERETNDLRMAEYAIENIGSEFKGQVIGTTPFGVNVKLEGNVKGIIRNREKRTYRIGQKLFVLIKDVSIPHRVIYLEPTEKNKRGKGKVYRNRR